MIKVKDIPVFYLNPDFFDQRRKMMDEFLSNLNLNKGLIKSIINAS